jgi:hypothetical protein
MKAHHPQHLARGAAMAETAMVLSFTMILLFGILQVVLIGYLQVAGDAAVFMAAHEYTLGVTQTNITNAEQSMVPSVIATNVTFTPAPPPNVNPSPFTSIYGTINQNSRSGGYSMVRPQNYQVYLKSAALYNGVLGFNNMPLSSGAVEPYYLMSNSVMNNSGDGPNDPNALSGSYLNPGDASPFEPDTDTAATNMNVPPYYAPTRVLEFCGDPYVNNFGSRFFSGGSATTCSNPENMNLGLAEYLDNDNYALSAMGVNSGDVFSAMAGHQRIYVDLIAAFPAIPVVTGDQIINDIQQEFQNYNASTLTFTNTACGAKTPTAKGMSFTCSGFTGEPLVYYDPMFWWEFDSQATTGFGAPTWVNNRLWAAEVSAAATGISKDSGGDAPSVPGVWGGALPSTVYAWDQPNAPHNVAGPGQGYPFYPFAGMSSAGDPGY